MTNHAKYMERCLCLAKAGAGFVSPNPMVGCVIVYNGKIIGEGFHREFGGPHAEVNAVASVNNQDLLKESILYVSLEPCAHYGKTPPCCDLIVEKGIPQVVIGTVDPFPGVRGKGIHRLKKAGVSVETGVLEQECRELNRRFITFHEKKRPYVFLKWAQTLDGYIDRDRTATGSLPPVQISNALARQLVHRSRAYEDAILIGTETALKDDPSLTVREWSGTNPFRLVIDRNNRLPRSLAVFDHGQMTLVFTEKELPPERNICFEKINFSENVPVQILEILFTRNIQSLIVEGGAFTLRRFIDQNLWDEAQIYTAPFHLCKGIKAPEISGSLISVEYLDDNILSILRCP